MRVLFVYSGNSDDGIRPFVLEQAQSLEKQGIIIDFFPIKGKGWLSYAKHIIKLHNYVKKNDLNLIHAHFLWSGLVAIFQKKIPVIVTFHGSDIYNKILRIASKYFLIPFAKKVIFVNPEMKYLAKTKKGTVIPCGINVENLFCIDKTQARKKLDWPLNKKLILFSSSFDRKVKNYQLANNAIEILKDESIQLIEFTGFSIENIRFVYNACDLLLMTSLWEGSPIVVKEAMACNLPIVSTDVGDVKEIFGSTEGYYLTSFEPKDIAEKIKRALIFVENKGISLGRNRLYELGLDSDTVAKKIISLYKSI